jgi:Cu(I)/Ag(I) efflux system membrane fusion protein
MIGKSLIASASAIAVVVVFWFVRGSGASGPTKPGAGMTARTVLCYRDPMHPSYTSDRPGKAPDCGMDLEAVYAGGDESTRGITRGNAIHVSRDRQHMIGLRIDRVERSAPTQKMRTFGRVALDESGIFPVITSADGWVTEIAQGASTGDAVRKGQPLVSVFGRDYSTAQRTFLYALRASENPPPGLPGDSQEQLGITLREARRGLQGLGFQDAQVQQLTRTRQVTLDVTLAAPASGIIVARNVFQKQRFDRGVELFRIVDLSRVWIVADVFGADEAYIRSGTEVEATLPGRPGARFTATVDETLPRFDSGSRSLKVRLNVENHQRTLRPEMLVELAFPVTLPDATTVPEEAVIESGLEETVFVARDEESFEPRPVKTGWRYGGRVQILQGLSPGESIVVSGLFLLDSERRIRHEDAGSHD